MNCKNLQDDHGVSPPPAGGVGGIGRNERVFPQRMPEKMTLHSDGPTHDLGIRVGPDMHSSYHCGPLGQDGIDLPLQIWSTRGKRGWLT